MIAKIAKRLGKYAGAGFTAGALLTVGGPGAAAWAGTMPVTHAHADHHGWSGHRGDCESPCLVKVRMTQKGFWLPRSIHAGLITFRVSTPDAQGHTLQGFKLKSGETLSETLAAFRKAVSHDPATSAAGIRELGEDITAVGGAMVDPVTPVWATLPLEAGKYYFFDFNELFVPGGRVHFQPLCVHGDFEPERPPAHQGTIVQRDTPAGPRFSAPRWFDTDNTFLVVNRAPEIHEAVFEQVKPGTENEDLTAYFNVIAHGGTPAHNPFAEQGMRGLAGMSPGRHAWLHFDPPAGTYALLCFIPDDMTGIPHAFEGMHRIIHLS